MHNLTCTRGRNWMQSKIPALASLVHEPTLGCIDPIDPYSGYAPVLLGWPLCCLGACGRRPSLCWPFFTFPSLFTDPHFCLPHLCMYVCILAWISSSRLDWPASKSRGSACFCISRTVKPCTIISSFLKNTDSDPHAGKASTLTWPFFLALCPSAQYTFLKPRHCRTGT